MGIAKRLNFNNIFIFLFLVLFPFGQIVRVGIIHPIDVVVGMAAMYAMLKKQPRPLVFVYLHNFLLIAFISWIFSVALFHQIQVLYGLLYLIRLFGYFYFLIYVWNFASNLKNRNLLMDSLLGISVVSAVFGWIQFFMIPDIKPFFTWGWDQHLFRLVGTFLDPTFLGLIIVFGLIMVISKGLESGWNKMNLLISAFLLISLAFTYSRASYLAFIVGIGYLFYVKNKIGYILYPILLLVGLIFVLPTARNHSIEFTRLFSAVARVENYKEAVKVFSFSPVFGVGYNNMCLARQKLIGVEYFYSHACSGSDSSLLFVLATTGVAGLFVFIHSIVTIGKLVGRGLYSPILFSCAVALLVHSVFSNSLFYSWIMGYMLILLSLSLGRESED